MTGGAASSCNTCQTGSEQSTGASAEPGVDKLSFDVKVEGVREHDWGRLAVPDRLYLADLPLAEGVSARLSMWRVGGGSTVRVTFNPSRLLDWAGASISTLDEATALTDDVVWPLVEPLLVNPARHPLTQCPLSRIDLALDVDLGQVPAGWLLCGLRQFPAFRDAPSHLWAHEGKTETLSYSTKRYTVTAYDKHAESRDPAKRRTLRLELQLRKRDVIVDWLRTDRLPLIDRPTAVEAWTTQFRRFGFDATVMPFGAFTDVLCEYGLAMTEAVEAALSGTYTHPKHLGRRYKRAVRETRCVLSPSVVKGVPGMLSSATARIDLSSGRVATTGG